MNSTSPFVTLEKSNGEAFTWIDQQLSKVGLEVNQTFDLQEARLSHPECPCPHHGAATCTCQMSVLLVYKKGQPPATILLHGFQDTTWLYLIDTPEQPINQECVILIRKALTAPESTIKG